MVQQSSNSSNLFSPFTYFSDVLSSVSSILPTSTTLQHGVVVGGAVTAGIVTISAVRSVWNMYSLRRKIRQVDSNTFPEGPPPNLLIGNVLQLTKGYYKTLYKYVDHPVSIFWVHSTPFVVINDSDGLRRVLGGDKGTYVKPRYFGYRSKAVSTVVDYQRASTLVTPVVYDPNADHSRAALDDLIRKSLPMIQDTMEELLQSLSRRDARLAKKEELMHTVRASIVKLNLQTLFDVHIEDKEASTISNCIGFAGEEFARRMVNPLRAFLRPWTTIRFVRDICRLIALGVRLCRVLDDTVLLASKGNCTAGIGWVHAWVGKVGPIGKLGKVIGLLMASTQTVPLTAVWMLHLVGNDVEVQTQLRDELFTEEIHSTSDISTEKIDKLRFLDAVVKETLRLYPPFPIIQRQAERDDVLCGVNIPKGTIVYAVPWLLHRNAKYWSEPHEFLPKRFDTEEGRRHGDSPNDWVYFPFGRGPRMCAGSKLAYTELKVLLIHAVLSYEWRSLWIQKPKDKRFPELGMVPRNIALLVSDHESKPL